MPQDRLAQELAFCLVGLVLGAVSIAQRAWIPLLANVGLVVWSGSSAWAAWQRIPRRWWKV